MAIRTRTRWSVFLNVKARSFRRKKAAPLSGKQTGTASHGRAGRQPGKDNDISGRREKEPYGCVARKRLHCEDSEIYRKNKHPAFLFWSGGCRRSFLRFSEESCHLRRCSVPGRSLKSLHFGNFKNSVLKWVTRME